jgi:hypothetical protein
MLEFLGELFASLLGGLIGDALAERRGAEKLARRMAKFKAGSVIAVPCALSRPLDGRGNWRSGVLRLSRGRAVWSRRFRKTSLLELNRHSSVGQYARRPAGHELLRISAKLIVLRYEVGTELVELAVRKGSLPLVGAVLDIPPTKL